MGTAKRERQKQGRQARIEAALAAQQKAQRKKTVRNFALVVVVIVAVLFGLSQFTGKSSSTTSTSSGDTASGAATSTTAAGTPVAVTVPPAGATLTGATPCPATDGSSPRTTTFAQAPPVCIDPAKSYSAKVDTSMGSFTIALDATKAPIATNNFVVLSLYHYYDGTAFHRIIPNFVVQGGDAVGPTPGQGGPGYQFADELPTGAAPYYPLQSVAMANSGANTNGSQFFVVTGDQGVSLPAKYTSFGMVTEGFDVVKSIEAVGTSGGTPSQVVTITTVTITES
jgi:peptidyl-prolyl cis-trans isomerase B (cyclophilin B)